MNVEVGDIFWTIKRSVEAQGYGEMSPAHPWQVKVVKIFDKRQAKVICACGFDDFVDRDTNATVYVGEEEVYRTEEEAKVAYLVDLQQHAQAQLFFLFGSLETTPEVLANVIAATEELLARYKK